MKKITGILQYTHTVIVLILFLVLVLVAGLSLFALSPVKYEEYVAYQKKLDEYNVASDRQGKVAGIQDQEKDLDFVNLLEGKDIQYEINQTTNNILLTASVRDPKSIEKDYLLSLLEIDNLSLRKREFKVELTYLGENYTQAEIVVNKQTLDNSQTFSILPNRSIEVSLLRDSSSVNTLESLQEDYSISLVIKEIESKEVVETD